MDIAILGTRGIPNAYGGFEQFAEYLSLGLVNAGHSVTVYNSDCHPYKKNNWNGVDIVHCYDPEDKIGTIGQFVYDLNCILDCKMKNFDIILQLGYTSSSVWLKLLDKKKFTVTTNMDGHEWMRSKYSRSVQQFLKFAEKLAVKESAHLIADSVAIQDYLKRKYNAKSTFIPYGAHVFKDPDIKTLDEYNLRPGEYNLLIARLEPENSIEVILDGVVKAQSNKALLVIGNSQTPYGKYIKSKFSNNVNIRFLNGIYDIGKLNNLRFYSSMYFHGHTVGGTNPSLLEAMGSHALICACDNVFNAAVLGPDAYYFQDAADIAIVINQVDKSEQKNAEKIKNNINKIESTYSWSRIVQQYIQHFETIRQRKVVPFSKSQNVALHLQENRL